MSGVTPAQAAQLVAGVRDLPVLTISDLDGFTELGGIAQFFFEHGQLRFSVSARGRDAGASSDQLEAAQTGEAKMTGTDRRENMIRGSRPRAAIAFAGLLALSSSAWAQSALPDLSLEELMKLDAGQVYGASERLQPVHRGARLGLLHHRRGDRAVWLPHAGGHPARAFAACTSPTIATSVSSGRADSPSRGLQQPHPAARQRTPRERQRLRTGGDRRGVRPRSGDVRACRNHPRARIVALRRQRVLRGRERDHADRRLAGRRLDGGRDRHAGDPAAAGAPWDTASRTAWSWRCPAPTSTATASDGSTFRRSMRRPPTTVSQKGSTAKASDSSTAVWTSSGLTVTGAYGSRQRDVPTASFGTVFNEQDPREQTTDRHTLIDAEYGRSFGGTRVTFRASFDRFSYDGIYPFAGGSEGAPTSIARQRRRRHAVERRQRTDPGLSRPADRDEPGSSSSTTCIRTRPRVMSIRRCSSSTATRSSTQHAVYVQDEIKLARWLIVNGGLRYDGYETFQRVTPRAALIFLPSSTQSLKYLYGNAFRAPNAYELNTYYFGDRSRSSAPGIDRHARARVGTLYQRLAANLRLDLLVQGRPADHPGTRRLDVPGHDVRQPGGSAGEGSRARSADAPQRRIAGVGQLRTSERGGSDDADELPNSPRHMVKARISLPGPTRRSFVSVEGQYLSSRETARRLEGIGGAPPSTSPWFSRSDDPGNCSAPCAMSSTISMPTPRPVDHRQDAIPQNGRTARIGLRWKLSEH